MQYRLWLKEVTQVSNGKKKQLCDVFGGAKGVYQATRKELLTCGVLEQKQVDAIFRQKEEADLQKGWQTFLASGQGFVTIEDKEYPQKLRDIYDAPYGLYWKGTLPKPTDKVVAIVGARACSAYGESMAQELAGALAKRGVWVVSGLAKGIDRFAHRGCLDVGGNTIAVLGSGVDVCYPKQNMQLYEQALLQGVVLSEYPPKTPPIPRQFPARNRIISGMADMVVVVEAREKSGSLITADFALEQGRDIYAIPGRMTDPLSVGCNRLVAQGAGMIWSLDEFIYNIEEIGFASKEPMLFQKETEFVLEKEELLVYSCFDFYPCSIENVMEKTQIDLFSLLHTIMNLCDKGFLREICKNEYVKCK